ncbi:MAG: hypothetical protein JWP74_2097, partial [Marmoricola sp.]|nr:hypothetical protein [Marmoricola sp.]
MSSGIDEGYGAPVVHPLVRLVEVIRGGLDQYGAANAWT